ncbi:MAG: hypothetical protein ACR2QC_02665 [Gammaproteobacteria bacterium]
MKHDEIQFMLRTIRESAESGYVPPRYLLAMREAAAGMRRVKDKDLRRKFDETLDSLRSCGIVSRWDSHHWDLGLCELECGCGFVCSSEGYIFCYDEDERKADVYSPEEVRAIGGAKF